MRHLPATWLLRAALAAVMVRLSVLHVRSAKIRGDHPKPGTSPPRKPSRSVVKVLLFEIAIEMAVTRSQAGGEHPNMKIYGSMVLPCMSDWLPWAWTGGLTEAWRRLDWSLDIVGARRESPH